MYVGTQEEPLMLGSSARIALFSLIALAGLGIGDISLVLGQTLEYHSLSI